MSRIASYFRSPTKPDVKNHADRQALKRTAIDPKTGEIRYDRLNTLLDHYPNARTLYAKKDWLGRHYVSFNEPKNGKYAYADKRALGTLAKIGLTDGFIGYEQKVFDAKQDLLSNLNRHGGAFEITPDFRQAALTLEMAQKNGRPATGETAQPAPASEGTQTIGEHCEEAEKAQHQLKNETPTIDADDLDLMDEIDATISVLDARTAFAIQETNEEVTVSLIARRPIRFAPTLLGHLPNPPGVAADQDMSDLAKLNYYLDKTNLPKQVGQGDCNQLIEYRDDLLKAEEKKQQAI